ncbi:amidase [Paraconexibacter sp.]|uniref:amidase n=1 Tax=Paraconexibacter sp. TaxID=2949640 RepID=UPI00356797FD
MRLVSRATRTLTTTVVIVRNVFITPTAPERPIATGHRLAVKDLFDTAGVRTTYGSAVFAEHVPTATAPAVLRLEAAGYVSVGKANLHEFAWGITSQNDHYGHVPNPLAADRIAGGSSGGCAAALAAGLADAGLGTDSGGSIRIPSACCGTVGFKPTHGLVPLGGCFPLAPSFDHAGPMARDVAGCERMLAALVPGFAPDPAVDLADLRVGLAWTAVADPLVRARVEEAAAHFGSVVRLDLPFPDGTYPVFNREAAEVHADLLLAHRDRYSDNVAAQIERALTVADAEVTAAAGVRDAYRELLAGILEDVDLLLTPTMPMVAPPAAGGERPIRARTLSLTYPFNAIGAPVLALPCGPAEDGLPASVQLVAAAGADGRVLAAGRALEAALRG